MMHNNKINVMCTYIHTYIHEYSHECTPEVKIVTQPFFKLPSFSIDFSWECVQYLL